MIKKLFILTLTLALYFLPAMVIWERYGAGFWAVMWLAFGWMLSLAVWTYLD